MASYGVFTAACGFEYHGPKGYMAFAPRLTPEAFKAAFTAAEGWGTFAQRIAEGKLSASIDLKSGRLRLRTLALAIPEGVPGKTVAASVNGKAIPAALVAEAGRARVTFEADLNLERGQRVEVIIS